MSTSKAEQTRGAIVGAAMRLFRQEGYDRTTMRAIATEAGVSVGNAYYYFGSKEHLVQAFYDQLQVEHAEAAAQVLDGDRAFARRLEGVLLAWLDVAAPHHEFAGQFFRNAADPRSPLSPFSEESTAARDASIALFATLLDGSDAKLAPALRAELPDLLWLLQMGTVLFWVYDASPDQERTRTLVRRIVPIVDRLVRLSRMPVVRGVVDDVVGLMRELRS
ncbi:TetR family transcriptional regulator [Nocardioides sp. Root1257]|uniref:TetR/AcrR family transcriptional regulator n=1 Tax=unclassified Nocardioides TaxID=2615069 RepID=UPI000701C0CF|nr:MULTISPECIES: TetR family transcriptional regulator [unclassified Nocardioides]KQW46991.1 TetR family transcriptional regulator [Nocardioides sp. Root1257]KRC43737.1 TetR family transcriptional regulator [Nocardioides sp. Root224]